MTRIIISPKACAVAAALLQHKLNVLNSAAISDQFIATQTSLEEDTVYRALVELADLGAITFTRRQKNEHGSHRAVTLNLAHWAWAAIQQQLLEDGAL